MELPPKLWFQLERLKKAFLSTFGTSTQNYDTSHRMCSNCRALVERGASVCPFCGEKLRSRPGAFVPRRPRQNFGRNPHSFHGHLGGCGSEYRPLRHLLVHDSLLSVGPAQPDVCHGRHQRRGAAAPRRQESLHPGRAMVETCDGDLPARRVAAHRAQPLVPFRPWSGS